ncbi:MAG: methylenetetrahydrofolate--tRNA-(uracil(54)-C(5))-methyltransferase (FADH(2)-oxidizing) TrmFO, partial [Myxococcota bacterium]
MQLSVIGAGLAGCEAAWQAAERGLDVVLHEMKPVEYSPAHRSPDFAELVCSNSLRSNEPASAVGLLKEEMRRLGSLVLQAADECAVPAGRALAVDRVAFSARITDAVQSHRRIRIVRERVERLPADGCTVLATGPLTASSLAGELQRLLGEPHLYFYDALSPIVYADSIDHEVAFRASRYGEGDDYLNLPLDREAYQAFVADLLASDTVPLHDFEQAHRLHRTEGQRVASAAGHLLDGQAALEVQGLLEVVERH